MATIKPDGIPVNADYSLEDIAIIEAEDTNEIEINVTNTTVIVISNGGLAETTATFTGNQVKSGCDSAKIEDFSIVVAAGESRIIHLSGGFRSSVLATLDLDVVDSVTLGAFYLRGC